MNSRLWFPSLLESKTRRRQALPEYDIIIILISRGSGELGLSVNHFMMGQNRLKLLVRTDRNDADVGYLPCTLVSPRYRQLPSFFYFYHMNFYMNTLQNLRYYLHAVRRREESDSALGTPTYPYLYLIARPSRIIMICTEYHM